MRPSSVHRAFAVHPNYAESGRCFLGGLGSARFLKFALPVMQEEYYASGPPADKILILIPRTGMVTASAKIIHLPRHLGL